MKIVRGTTDAQQAEFAKVVARTREDGVVLERFLEMMGTDLLQYVDPNWDAGRNRLMVADDTWRPTLVGTGIEMRRHGVASLGLAEHLASASRFLRGGGSTLRGYVAQEEKGRSGARRKAHRSQVEGEVPMGEASAASLWCTADGTGSHLVRASSPRFDGPPRLDGSPRRIISAS